MEEVEKLLVQWLGLHYLLVLFINEKYLVRRSCICRARIGLKGWDGLYSNDASSSE